MKDISISDELDHLIADNATKLYPTDELIKSRLIYYKGAAWLAEQYDGISPSTVTEMIEALRAILTYHSDKPTGFIEGHKLGGTEPFLKAKYALSKADKELKK